MTSMVIPPLHELPRLRDRVTVAGYDGVYIVIACNSLRGEVDLAGASHPGFLFNIPVSKIRPVSDFQSGRMNSCHAHAQTRLARLS